MAGKVNISIIGNVGKDPEVRTVTRADGSTTMVANFNVAVNQKRANGNEEVTWYRCAAWGALAEKVVVPYVKKGTMVAIDSNSIKANPYLNKDGEPEASLELSVDKILLLGSKSGERSGNTPSPENEDDIPF